MKNNLFLTVTILILNLLFLNDNIFGQPAIEWEKSLGGSGEEIASTTQQTNDGGYIVAGYSTSNDGDVSNNNGDADAWVVKLNFEGNIEWERSYGGSQYDEAKSIKQTEEGGYIFVGESSSNDGDVGGNLGLTDFWVVKLDSEGALEWEKNYGGSDFDFATDIQQTTDGGYIVAGYSSSNDGDVSNNNENDVSDLWILKLDSSGNLVWENSFGTEYDDQALSIAQTSEGGYIVAGHIGTLNANLDLWVIKLNSSGNLIWEKTFGGSDIDEATAIRQTADEGYIVAGATRSGDGDVGGNNGNTDYWVLKLSPLGILIWEKTFGGSDPDRAQSIQQTIDGGYIVAGTARSNDGDVGENNGNSDYWIVKLDADGNLIWEENYGGSGHDIALSIQQTAEQGYVLAGLTQSNDGDVSSNDGAIDFWILKLAPFTVGTNSVNPGPKVVISPNPANGEFSIVFEAISNSIRVQIFDVLGHSIYVNNSNIGQIGVNSIPRGIYWVNISSEGFAITRKLIVK